VKPTRRLFVALLLCVGVAGGFTALHVRAEGSGTPRLTVREALGLCTAGRTTHLGAVMVEGYAANARVAILPRPLRGFFPTRQVALSRAHAAPGTLPPSNNGVWLRNYHGLNGARRVTVTGNLDCVYQLPGMGDAGGTFAWLTLPNGRSGGA
jgi:hypothetical protein